MVRLLDETRGVTIRGRLYRLIVHVDLERDRSDQEDLPRQELRRGGGGGGDDDDDDDDGGGGDGDRTVARTPPETPSRRIPSTRTPPKAPRKTPSRIISPKTPITPGRPGVPFRKTPSTPSKRKAEVEPPGAPRKKPPRRDVAYSPFWPDTDYRNTITWPYVRLQKEVKSRVNNAKRVGVDWRWPKEKKRANLEEWLENHEEHSNGEDDEDENDDNDDDDDE